MRIWLCMRYSHQLKGPHRLPRYFHIPFIKATTSCGGGELLEDKYFAHTVFDKVTAEVIRKYIQHHRKQEKSPTQLELF
jgi:REP element-mobilizing transposase RayT